MAEWQAGGPVASLAYDPDQARLLVGMTRRGGRCITYDLAAFLVSARRARAAGRGADHRDRPGGRERDRRAAGPARPPLPRPGRDRGDGEGHRGGAGAQRAGGGRRRLRAGHHRRRRPAARSWWPPTSTATCWWSWTRPRCCPIEDINGEPRVESLPSPADRPARGARPAVTTLQVWVPVGPLPADNEHPAVAGRHHRLRRARPGDRHGAAAGHAVADRLAVGGQHHLHRRLRRVEPASRRCGPCSRSATAARQSAGFAAFDTTLLPRPAAGHGASTCPTTTRTRTTPACWYR